MDVSTIDPEGSIPLHATLDDGPPLPMYLLQDIRTRRGDEDVVIQTTRNQVHLRSNGTSSDGDLNDSMVLPLPHDPIQTPFPGITRNPKYVLNYDS